MVIYERKSVIDSLDRQSNRCEHSQRKRKRRRTVEVVAFRAREASFSGNRRGVLRGIRIRS